MSFLGKIKGLVAGVTSKLESSVAAAKTAKVVAVVVASTRSRPSPPQALSLLIHIIP